MTLSDFRAFATFLLVRGRGASLLLLPLLLALLMAPSTSHAQSLSARVMQVDGSKVLLKVSFSAPVKEFSVTWGDGEYSNANPPATERSHIVKHNYGGCGKKSIAVNAVFKNGHMSYSSAGTTIDCSPAPNHPQAQPIENGSSRVCDIDSQTGLQISCRANPPYFVDNLIALNKFLEEIGRRQEVLRAQGKNPNAFEYPDIMSFGYRCPDTLGHCPTVWIPGPSSTHGLSKPDSFAKSELQTRPHTGLQRINQDGIGDQAILNLNPIDAVNIWGPGSDSGGEVCFKGTTGRLLYVDSRPTPNTKHWLTPYIVGNTICGNLPGPGSIIYLPPEG